MAGVFHPLNGGSHPGHIYVYECVVTCSGGAGTSTGTHTSAVPFSGRVVRVDVIRGTLVSTADITGKDTNQSVAAEALFLSKSNVAADFTTYPTYAQTQADGTARTSYDHYPVSGKLKFDIAQANNNDSVTIRTYIEG